MTKPFIKIHDIETGEIIEREMTDAEFAQYQTDIAAGEAELQTEATKATEKAALLDRLGISEEEAALLLA